jgi:hypothetical protein
VYDRVTGFRETLRQVSARLTRSLPPTFRSLSLSHHTNRDRELRLSDGDHTLEPTTQDLDFRFAKQDPDNLTLVIVTHGISLRVFLMRWYKYDFEQFGACPGATEPTPNS